MATKMKGKGVKRAGFIVSAELVLIATVMLFGLMIGLVAVRDGLIGELHDVGQAIGRLNQSYGFRGVADIRTTAGNRRIAWTPGSGWRDRADEGDERTTTAVILTPPEREAEGNGSFDRFSDPR